MHAGETPTHSIERYIGSGSLDRLRCVVAVYGVHTHGFSLVCDGVNLHDRDKAACECVSVFLSNLFYGILTRLCHHYRLLR